LCAFWFQRRRPAAPPPGPSPLPPPGAPTEGGGRGLFGIYESDEAFALIKENNAFIASLNTPIPGCVAAKSAGVGPVDECKATWVNGAPGTG
jgi:mannan endo-1,4-beta-mannosidase